MDDLIVIILTLIIAVVGALGQIKKRKQSHTENQNAGQEPGNFWDVFQKEQDYTVDQQTEMMQYETPEPLLSEKEKVESSVKPYDFSAENEGKSIFKVDKTIKAFQEKEPLRSKLKDFSLKKAVIYSEILNRKYN
jgi:hypothetical protein